MNEKPTHLDLFSGIGGFSLAFESEGFRTIGFSEIEPYACAVLRKCWPGVPNYGDVRGIPGVACDVITGGFPCQPFSVAGKRGGSKDDRFLWPAMLDVIQRCGPAWVLGENVPGIVGMELERVLVDLEGIGFWSQAFIVPALAVDARHRRDRVWIVAHAKGGVRQREAQREGGHAAQLHQDVADADGKRCEWNNGVSPANGFKAGNEPCNDTGAEGSMAREKDVANADKAGRGEQCGGEPIRAEQSAVECGGEVVADAERVRRGKSAGDSGAEWEPFCATKREEGAPGVGSGGEDLAHSRKLQRDRWSDGVGWWEREPLETLRAVGDGGREENGLSIAESELGRVADGLPNRAHRLKCLGNGIVPQVAQVFARSIYQELMRSKK